MVTVSGTRMVASNSAEVLRTALSKPDSAAAVLTAVMMFSANAVVAAASFIVCVHHVAVRNDSFGESLACKPATSLLVG